jgi:hypothetical protein
MLAKLLQGVRRFFGLEPPPAPPSPTDERTPSAWWIPKDGEALAASQAAKGATVVETAADEAPPHDAAPRNDHPVVDEGAEGFATLDEVAEILAEQRRSRDEEERRIASIEIPQAMMMDDQEYAIAKDWMLDHRALHPLPKTAIYGQYWLHFARSSVGDTVSIGCTTCGKNKVLTDFSRLAEHEDKHA